jgi:hypothetical protein
MTFVAQRPLKGRTRFCIAHNFGTDEETGYVFLHFFGAVLGVLWTRSEAAVAAWRKQQQENDLAVATWRKQQQENGTDWDHHYGGRG